MFQIERLESKFYCFTSENHNISSRECFSSGYDLARNFDRKILKKHRKKWRPEANSLIYHMELSDLEEESVLDELKILELLEEDDHEEVELAFKGL